MGLLPLVILEAMPLAVCTFLENEVVAARLLEDEASGILVDLLGYRWFLGSTA
jgi:hypothetical protein